MPADPAPPTVDGPPCLRCGGDLADHILTAGPDNGPDEYRCLRDELQDVIADLETSDPPAEPGWVEVLRGVEAAYKRSLVNVEGPIVMDRAQHHADMERIDAGDLVGTDTVTVMATLRDIADAEPLYYDDDQERYRCVWCGYLAASAVAEILTPPVPGTDRAHLISCPWHRATQIVGVKADG